MTDDQDWRNRYTSQGGSTPEQSLYPPQVDYSAVMAYMSDQSKTTALAQILSSEMALQQASEDRKIQAAANLELGLEKLDTKLQISKMEFHQQMTATQNEHQEKLAKIHVNLQNLEKSRSGPETDLPAPEFL